MKKKISLALIVSTVSTMLGIGIANAATIFKDVDSTNANFTAIEWMARNGVIKGYADGTYKPGNPVNRAEMLKMIFIADGNEKNAEASLATGKLFPDTPKSEWYAKYVTLARQRATVQGYPDGTFRPGNSINKAEAYKIVLKEFYNETTMTYTATHSDIPTSGAIPPDVKKTDWFVQYVNFAALKNIYDAGVLSPGMNGSYFWPAHNLTRGELAELIYRAKAVADNFPNNIEDSGSKFGPGIIGFDVNLYNYVYKEASGKPTFTINDPAHPNALIGYATKYADSLLLLNGDTPNTLKFLSGINHDQLDITIFARENKDQLSIKDFYAKQPINFYAKSKSHEDLMVNSLPAVWFHGWGEDANTTSEVVVVQFQTGLAEIIDHGNRHQTDGIFNYMVRNFWWKNLAI